MTTFSISSTVKQYPAHPFETIKNDILGKRYELSLAIVGPTRAQALNTTYRKKTYTPNVLSFPLTDSAGEIVICPAVAKREAKDYNLSVDGYIGFLFIHGCLHLKGHDHGATMEQLEQRYLRKYNLT